MAKDKADLLQGTLDLLVLKALQLEPQHGFGIAQRIQQLSSDVLRIEQGSLYPALYRLEERGWIRADWGTSDNNRKAKFYALTRTGRRRLEAEEASWARLSGRGQSGAAGGRAVMSAWRGWLTRMRRGVRRERLRRRDGRRDARPPRARGRGAAGARCGAGDGAARGGAGVRPRRVAEGDGPRSAGRPVARADGAGRALRRPAAGQVADLLDGRDRHHRPRRRRHRDDLQRLRRRAAAAAAVSRRPIGWSRSSSSWTTARATPCRPGRSSTGAATRRVSTAPCSSAA